MSGKYFSFAPCGEVNVLAPNANNTYDSNLKISSNVLITDTQSVICVLKPANHDEVLALIKN